VGVAGNRFRMGLTGARLADFSINHYVFLWLVMAVLSGSYMWSNVSGLDARLFTLLLTRRRVLLTWLGLA
jgi:hypothetical protein